MEEVDTEGPGCHRAEDEKPIFSRDHELELRRFQAEAQRDPTVSAWAWCSRPDPGSSHLRPADDDHGPPGDHANEFVSPVFQSPLAVARVGEFLDANSGRLMHGTGFDGSMHVHVGNLGMIGGASASGGRTRQTTTLQAPLRIWLRYMHWEHRLLRKRIMLPGRQSVPPGGRLAVEQWFQPVAKQQVPLWVWTALRLQDEDVRLGVFSFGREIFAAKKNTAVAWRASFAPPKLLSEALFAHTWRRLVENREQKKDKAGGAGDEHQQHQGPISPTTTTINAKDQQSTSSSPLFVDFDVAQFLDEEFTEDANRPWASGDLQTVRRSPLNLANLLAPSEDRAPPQKRTVEFRQMAATIHRPFAEAWVTLCTAMGRAWGRAENNVAEEDAVHHSTLPPETIQEYKRRAGELQARLQLPEVDPSTTAGSWGGSWLGAVFGQGRLVVAKRPPQIVRFGVEEPASGQYFPRLRCGSEAAPVCTDLANLHEWLAQQLESRLPRWIGEERTKG